MIDIDSLNNEQRNAVIDFAGPTLILAGAGTGKTRVITTRIAYMLQSGVNPNNIAAMTFTNKAAKEMRERVQEIIGPGKGKGLSVGTFHSFCLNVLRRYSEEAGIGGKFTLIGTSDQLDLVGKALEEKGWTKHFKADSLLFQISNCKNWLISPEDLKNGIYPRQPVDDPAVLAEIYELYERQLQLNRALDFDDCIYKVVKLLRKNEVVRDKLRKKFQYLLIDEFQDTNSSQFAIIEELAGDHNNVCVVGDDDQSIYSWRGAMAETMERFQTTFKGTTVVKLEQNYRCTNVILNAANSVIQNNTKRMEKTLWSSSKDSHPVIIAPAPDAIEEARWVGSKCIELLGIGHKPAEIAILYRSNSQAKLMEMALRECNVTYRTFGGQSFFERKEVKNFLGYLRLIANPADHLALWRVINSPTRGIGLKTQENIESLALRHKLSPYSILRDRSKEFFTGRSLESIDTFVQKIESIRGICLESPEDLETLGTEIISSFKLIDEIKKSITNVVARHHKSENLRSMPNWLEKSAEDMVNQGQELDAYLLLDKLTLSEAPTEKKDDGEPNYVSLMTIHASKGLEYPVIFVVGCEEGLLPHKNSVEDPGGVFEERRLFYVALTRAKRKLHLSYSAFRQTGFAKERRKPSRFLAELPDDMGQIEKLEEHRENYEEQQKDKRTRTKNKLANLRKSLMSGEWD